MKSKILVVDRGNKRFLDHLNRKFSRTVGSSAQQALATFQRRLGHIARQNFYGNIEPVGYVMKS
jgi:hypothetical protein